MQNISVKPEGKELVIGIIAPLGADLDLIYSTLNDTLLSVGFTSEPIKLIDLLKEVEAYKNLPESPIEDRYKARMKAGTEFREKLNRGDALALIGIAKIIRTRELQKDKFSSERIIPKHVYILRSLKHPDEVHTLRKVYGPGFIAMSAYSPREIRLQNLLVKIAESHYTSQSSIYRAAAEDLIQHDESEDDNKFGQHLRKTFWRADVFIDVSDPTKLQKSIARFVELLFGNTFRTPTRDEVAMFHAQAAALRSSSLARQVGAAIATEEGDIIAVGTNEVPKAGGGLYWCDDEPDHRDMTLGYDASDRMRRTLLADILNRLKNNNWLALEKREKDVESLVQEALSEGLSPLMKDARFTHIIEFTRAVHAEMAALMDAARRGVAVKESTLYTTTFPCHDCAKHIVAAGIKRVVYIEPYPKSLVNELYVDSIAVDSPGPSNKQVAFEPFVGIAPRQYLALFSMMDRKDSEGRVLRWQNSQASPRLYGTPPYFLASEKDVVANLDEKMEQSQLIPVNRKENENA